METWIWISLWAVQTFIGAVLWRKYAPKEGFYRIENGLWALFVSSLVISNLVGLLIVLGWFIDYLAGVKRHKEELDVWAEEEVKRQKEQEQLNKIAEKERIKQEIERLQKQLEDE